MKVVIYTALFGDRDILWSSPSYLLKGVKCVLFTERGRVERGLWTQGEKYGRPATVLRGTEKLEARPPTFEHRTVDMFSSPRRTARYYKTMSHKIFPDADVTIWLDANIRILVLYESAVSWLLGNDIAAFKHPQRNCVYEEIAACKLLKKGNRKNIERQERAYLNAGLPHKGGLLDTRCVIRRHTEKVKALNEMWWAEIEKFSERDQVALPYALWKQDMDISYIPGTSRRGQFFWFTEHGKHR